MQKEFKLYFTEKKSIRVIEVNGEYIVKKNNNIAVMINSNRNTRYITDEDAIEIKDNLLGASGNSLYHLVLFDKAKNKGLNGKKPLLGIEVI